MEMRVNSQGVTTDELQHVLRLEKENERLQRLVAELLIKNEQLRQLFLASASEGTAV
jgi:hypothetical protein